MLRRWIPQTGLAAVCAVAMAGMPLADVDAAGKTRTRKPGPAQKVSQAPSDDKPAANAANDDSTAGGEAADSADEEDEPIHKTDREWKKLLSPTQYRVTRLKQTEPPFSGKYARSKKEGVYRCVCCGAKLFASDAKFESGTGWPSFFAPVREKALAAAPDLSDGTPRVEVTCARCAAHLGHVFGDGPAPTGLRFCINSASLKLEESAASGKKPARAANSRPAPKR